MPDARRHRRAAAVVGLLAGLALLLGAIVDGGLSTPTRADGAGTTAAVPHGDAVAAPSALPGEDRPAWDASPLLSPVGLPGAAALVGLAVLAVSAGSGHRAPAVRAARHRGPPVGA